MLVYRLQLQRGRGHHRDGSPAEWQWQVGGGLNWEPNRKGWFLHIGMECGKGMPEMRQPRNNTKTDWRWSWRWRSCWRMSWPLAGWQCCQIANGPKCHLKCIIDVFGQGAFCFQPSWLWNLHKDEIYWRCPAIKLKFIFSPISELRRDIILAAFLYLFFIFAPFFWFLRF